MQRTPIRSRAARLAVLLAGVLPTLSGCGTRYDGTPPPAAKAIRPEVYTTFHPTAYFAERIVGSTGIPVINACPRGIDPAFWDPTPEEIGRFQRARLVVINGADFEQWVARTALARTRVVDTSAGFTDEFIEHERITHSHGPGGAHEHGGIDGHTWLEPHNAMRQAAAIRDALAKAFPEHADAFAHGYAELETDLRALDAELDAIDLDGVTVLANHPAYDYLARRYGWTLTTLAVDPDGDAEAGAAAVREGLAGAGGAPALMLWESEPGTELGAAVAALGVRSVRFSPAESVAEGEDYLSIMRDNALRLAEAAQSVPRWTALFNGRDLTGWTPKFTGYPLGKNLRDTFRVEDGTLVVSYDHWDRFDGAFGHLFYAEAHSHYRLRLEYRFIGEQTPGGPGWAFRNNGIMVHGQSAASLRADQDFPVSIEVQLLGGDGTNERHTGNLCTPGTNVVMDGELVLRHCTDSNSPTFHGDDWVRAEVEVRGGELIRHIIDGAVVLEYTEPQLDDRDPDGARLLAERSGEALLASGTIALQAESHGCAFRDIELLPLPGDVVDPAPR